MPKITIRGVKSYRSKGRVYHYHRATGVRIDIDLNASPEAFLAKLAELDRVTAKLPTPQKTEQRIETLGGLFDAWRQSEEWKGLKTQTKRTYERVIAPTDAPLREELASTLREGNYVLVNDQGQPYTRDGLQTNLWKLVKSLVAEGLVKPGLCFHGLRHSLGAALYDLGLDREARKAALGHSSDAASMVYERGGNRRAASDRAFAALDAHLAAAVEKPKNAK